MVLCFVRPICGQHPRLVIWNSVFGIMKKAITIWKDTFILLKSWCREDFKSRVSGFDFLKQGEVVTVDIPCTSHLAPCVAHGTSWFWPEVWHVSAERLSCVLPGCPYGGKPVTLAAAPHCCWQPRTAGGVLESALQTMIISSAVIDWKSPSACSGESSHGQCLWNQCCVYAGRKKMKKSYC